MFKRSLAILISVVYLSGLFSPFYIYAGYLLNKNYIASSICENRDKPELHCDGKCYLDQQLAKSAEQQSDSEQNVPAPVQSQVMAPHHFASFSYRYFPTSGVVLQHSDSFFYTQEDFTLLFTAPPEFSA